MFKFRKEKRETGLRAVGNPYPTVRIKIGKDVIGYIEPPDWRSERHEWCVCLKVKKTPTKESPADFKWVRLKKKFESEEAAREHLLKPETFDFICGLDLCKEPDDYSDRD